jgi:hypothetical protein
MKDKKDSSQGHVLRSRGKDLCRSFRYDSSEMRGRVEPLERGLWFSRLPPCLSNQLLSIWYSFCLCAMVWPKFLDDKTMSVYAVLFFENNIRYDVIANSDLSKCYLQCVDHYSIRHFQQILTFPNVCNAFIIDVLNIRFDVFSKFWSFQMLFPSLSFMSLIFDMMFSTTFDLSKCYFQCVYHWYP